MIHSNFPSASQIRKDIESASRIVISTHKRPDGDAIGSATGLAQVVRKLNPNVIVVIPGECPDFLKWIPGYDMVRDYFQQKEEIDRWMEDTDLVFITDYHEISRCGDFSTVLGQSKALVYMIDHHVSEEGLPSEYGIIDEDASSACEVIYRFLTETMDAGELMDRDTATSLYAGIMTDTGCFSYNSSSPALFRVVADLLEMGIDKNSIYAHIYYAYPPRRLALLAECLSNMKVYPEYGTAYMTLPHSVQQEYGYESGDCEGFVNEPMAISGIYCTAFFTEQKTGGVKASFRSRGSFSVNELANTTFGGGGHVNASGADIKMPLPEVEEAFLAAVKDRASQILSSCK